MSLVLPFLGDIRCKNLPCLLTCPITGKNISIKHCISCSKITCSLHDETTQNILHWLKLLQNRQAVGCPCIKRSPTGPVSSKGLAQAISGMHFQGVRENKTNVLTTSDCWVWSALKSNSRSTAIHRIGIRAVRLFVLSSLDKVKVLYSSPLAIALFSLLCRSASSSIVS